LEIEDHYQFSKAYHEILDESIIIDPTFAYAYNRKSIAYLKSGDFVSWKYYTDKAVLYNPLEYLGHRGYIRYLCFRDYEGALRDFDRLDSLGYRSDQYGMARALCYKSIGQHDKAIEILETAFRSEDHSIGHSDYLHLGVIYLEKNEYRKAVNSFLKQSEENENAENQFYLALAYKGLDMPAEYKKHLNTSKELYMAGNRLSQLYIDPIHKIYLANIEDELVIVESLSLRKEQ